MSCHVDVKNRVKQARGSIVSGLWLCGVDIGGGSEQERVIVLPALLVVPHPDQALPTPHRTLSPSSSLPMPASSSGVASAFPLLSSCGLYACLPRAAHVGRVEEVVRQGGKGETLMGHPLTTHPSYLCVCVCVLCVLLATFPAL